MSSNPITKAWRSYRRGGPRGLFADVRGWLETRPGAPPLGEGQVAAIRRSLEASAPAPDPPGLFPAIEELEALWPVVHLQRRLLRPHNPGDAYFDPVDAPRAGGIRIAKCLFEVWLFLRWRPAALLEIGTRTGLSLVNKLAFLPAGSRSTALCIDPYLEQGSPATVRRNLRLQEIPDGDVHFLVGDSKAVIPELAARFPGLRFDTVLVDGSHDPDDAFADLRLTLPLLAPGGTLVFDDAGPTAPGIRGHDLIDVWNRALEGHEAHLETRHYAAPNGFCVARRR